MRHDHPKIKALQKILKQNRMPHDIDTCHKVIGGLCLEGFTFVDMNQLKDLEIELKKALSLD